MNIKRKGAIKSITSELKDIKTRLEIVLEHEQEYYDNVPENLQGYERYEISEEAIDKLSSVINNLEKALGGLEELSEWKERNVYDFSKREKMEQEILEWCNGDYTETAVQAMSMPVLKEVHKIVFCQHITEVESARHFGN